MKKTYLIILFGIVTIFLFINLILAQQYLNSNSTWYQNISGSEYFHTTIFGDIDNDGDMDLLEFGCSGGSLLNCGTEQKTRIYTNNGTSLIENITWEQNLSKAGEDSAVFGDIDNDGDLDLILLDGTRIYTNNGTSFVENLTWYSEIEAQNSGSDSVTLGDIDNDGDLDLVFIDIGQVRNSTFLNNGTSFVASPSWGQEAVFDWRSSNALVDFDNDGDLDVISLGYDYSNGYINNGTAFELSPAWSGYSEDHGSLAVGDIDNDGDMDVIQMGETRLQQVLINDGSQLIDDDSWDPPLGFFYGSLALGDYDNDGFLDLAAIGVLGGTTYSRIYHNNGTTFLTADEDNVIAIQSDSVVWIDVDNDGDLDLVAAYIYTNNITTPNTAPTSPISFSNTYNNRVIKLGWQNGSDAETPSTGLYYNMMLGTSTNNHSIISGVYGGQGDVSGGGGIAFGYFGNMMQRKNFSLKVDRLTPGTTYVWYVQTIDTALKAGNWSAMQSFTTPADMTRPNITLNTPVAYFNSSSYTVTFNVTAWDNINLTNVSLWGSWLGGWHLNQTNSSGLNNTDYIFTLDLTGEADGTYTWQIVTEDNSTNVQNSSIRNFTLDTTAPDLSIAYPSNNTNYNLNTLDINYTVSDNVYLSSCWYSNDSYDVNTSITCGENITSIVWSEGQHNVTIWANDSVGHVNKSHITFNVDSIIPYLLITYPSNNTNSTDNTLDINYTVSDTNLDSCWYSNTSGAVNYTWGCNNITNITWDEAKYNVTIWANDTFGNVNSSRISFMIDNSTPIVNLVSPANDSTWSSSSTVTFSYNVTDVDIANCSLIINGAIDQTDTTITENTTQSFTKSLSNANYNWNINCTDYMRYTNSSEIRRLTVGYTAPSSPSGGGGGGSSITTPAITPTPEQFDVDFSSTNSKTLESEQGNIKTFSFNSLIQHSITVLTVSSNSITLLITSDPITVQIKTGETKQIDLNLDEIYDFEIKLLSIISGKAKFTLTRLEGADIVAQEELEKEPLFDVKVSLADKYKNVLQGEEITAEVQVVNVNNIGQVDVVVDYYIIDKNNKTKLTEGGDTLAVEAVTSFVRTLTIPEDALPGVYYFGVDVTYSNLTTSGRAEFHVRRLKIGLKEILIGIGVIVIITAGIIAYLVLKKRGEKLEKEMKKLKDKFKKRNKRKWQK